MKLPGNRYGRDFPGGTHDVSGATVFDPLGVSKAPFRTRRNFFFESRHILAWGVVAGLVEGNFAAVAVAQIFGGGPMLINIAATTPVAAHLANLLWGMLCVGRPKVRVMTVCTAGVVLLIGAVAFIPLAPWAGWLFVAQMAAAQFFMTGTVTTRAALWQANYPQWARGQLSARLQIFRAITQLSAVAIGAALIDVYPNSFRLLYPLVAVVGVVAIVFLQRITVQGEGREPSAIGATGDDRLTERVRLTAVLSPHRVITGAARVLRADSRFRNYCLAQMFAGFANLTVRSVVVVVIARDLLGDMPAAFWMSAVMLEVMPRLMTMGSMARFAAFFDRVGVLRFRVMHGSCWIVALVLGWIGSVVVAGDLSASPNALLAGIGIFVAFSLVRGICYGGAAIAWNLGHLHFAHPDDADVYMGIHVSLTGLRGLIMPSVGILLWHGVGSWDGIGTWVWGVATGFAVVALIVYVILARAESSRTERTSESASTRLQTGL